MIDSVTFTVTNRLSLIEDTNSPGGGLTKLGSGTLTLAGVNSYTGNTTVSAGTLRLVQATLGTNSTVTVSNGAVLNLGFAVTNPVADLVLNGVSQPSGVYNSTTATPFITGSGSLLIQPSVVSVANYPTNITFSISVSNLNLSWPATHLGWYVQSNSVNLANSNFWHDIPNSQSGTSLSISINPTKTNVFYRLSNTSKP